MSILLLPYLSLFLIGLCLDSASGCSPSDNDHARAKVQSTLATTPRIVQQQHHHRSNQQVNLNLNASICGTPDRIPTEQEEIMLQTKIAELQKNFANTKTFNPVTIDVSFQVIADGTIATDIPQQFIVDQMTVLNTNFATHGFQFNLRETKRTNNAQLHSQCSSSLLTNDQSFKTPLRNPNDGPNVLYFYTCLLSERTGYATFPNEAAGSPLRDGIVCHSQSLPGGSLAGFIQGGLFVQYNLGDTAVHEVGHWLGLFHTFEGGCTGNGDSVDDTPAVAEPFLDCPVSRDSCPNDPGNDQVNNHMSYSDDVCKTEFTNGQALRMQASWDVYRSPNNCDIFQFILAFILKIFTFGLIKLCR